MTDSYAPKAHPNQTGPIGTIKPLQTPVTHNANDAPAGSGPTKTLGMDIGDLDTDRDNC